MQYDPVLLHTLPYYIIAKLKLVRLNLFSLDGVLILSFVSRAGGVEIRGLHATPITKRLPLGVPVLEKNEFIANFGKSKMKVTFTSTIF